MKTFRVLFLVALCASFNSYSFDHVDKHQKHKMALSFLTGSSFGAGFTSWTRFLASGARVDNYFKASMAITFFSTLAGATVAFVLDKNITENDIKIRHVLLGAGFAMMTTPFATRALIDNNEPFETQDFFVPLVGALSAGAGACAILMQNREQLKKY